jgi:cytochrome c oxidase cbb3-type subunit 1
MARLCRVPIRYPGFLVLGGAFWNFGVLLAVLGVLMGHNTGLENMELPRSAAWLMFIGYLLIGLWGAVLYRMRKTSTVFISVWYLLGAFFWFPLLFSSANLLVGLPQMEGVMQNVVSAWFGQGLLVYWFTAIGLAAAYYLIPKVIDRPIHSYGLASIAFWTWALFSGLTAMTRLSGGPVPAWLVTLSIAANILMLVPIVTLATNLLKTMHGHYHMVYHSPTIRFTFFGAICFCISAVVGLLASLRSVDRIVHFTLFQGAHNDIVLYSFFSMVMFGAIYYITPRLVGCEWLSSTLIKVHFLGSAYGGGTAIVSLLLAGVATGIGLADAENNFSQVVQFGQFYLPGRIIGLALVTLGHTAFGLHFLLMLLRIGQPGGRATLFAPIGGARH